MIHSQFCMYLGNQCCYDLGLKSLPGGLTCSEVRLLEVVRLFRGLVHPRQEANTNPFIHSFLSFSEALHTTLHLQHLFCFILRQASLSCRLAQVGFACSILLPQPPTVPSHRPTNTFRTLGGQGHGAATILAGEVKMITFKIRKKRPVKYTAPHPHWVGLKPTRGVQRSHGGPHFPSAPAAPPAGIGAAPAARALPSSPRDTPQREPPWA